MRYIEALIVCELVVEINPVFVTASVLLSGMAVVFEIYLKSISLEECALIEIRLFVVVPLFIFNLSQDKLGFSFVSVLKEWLGS